MKYKDQFYNEGLATTFYVKPLKLVKKKIKNTGLRKIVCVTIKIVYIILAIIFGIVMFIVNFPL